MEKISFSESRPPFNFFPIAANDSGFGAKAKESISPDLI